MKKTVMILSSVMLLVAGQLMGQLKLASIFTDHMVLQQQTESPVWGKAAPNQKITVTTSWDKLSRQVVTDATGAWKAELKTPVAGGPYSITVKAGKKEVVQLTDVMIGEVWICSGQSNMEWRVKNDIRNMNAEIAAAKHPHLRMITVEKQTSMRPADDCRVEGGWKVCSPETVGDFSAVAYFFGREILQSQNVPVGLISTSWGGTLAEVWVDGESLEQMPYFSEYVKNLRSMPNDPAELEKLYQQHLSNWLDELNTADPGVENGRLLWAEKEFNDAGWYDFPVPGMVQTVGMTQKNGVFWFRKEVEIPASWQGKELTLKLGSIDDDDFTYFNGVLVGKTEGWMTPREYRVPAELVKAGKAVVAIRVLDTGGLGGLGTAKENFRLSCSAGVIDISGNWKARFSLALNEVSIMPRRFEGNMNEPTVLYNAMIHPIIDYSVKGAIWYQGESNAGRARQYRELLPLLIQSWRTKFGHNFPFYIVQLANYMQTVNEPAESAWAELREAQLNTLHLNNTGLAVTIDIGEANDIHPRNKQDVGLRLALNARATTYGENIPFSGPLYRSYEINGSTISLSFDHTDGGLQALDKASQSGDAGGQLQARGAQLKGFAIAGVDKKFYWAEAKIVGDKIVVSSPQVAFPVAVRYAWADNPVCNLYNGAGLPASPFRTDSWDGVTR